MLSLALALAAVLVVAASLASRFSEVHAASNKPAIKGGPLPVTRAPQPPAASSTPPASIFRKRNSKYDDKVGAEPGSRFIAL
jgi:hypothetical protein